MTRADAAAWSLKNGNPADALAQLQDQVRANPADAKLRVFLFQLLCVLGQWDRALNQLDVASNLDPGALAMAQTYADAVRCETVRHAVFAGKTSPMVLGQPEQWLALLIESILVAGQGQRERSRQLQAQAFEAAPTSSGDLDGTPFSWISDADSRLGPVLEAVINGRYYWVPFSRLTKVQIEPPEDLRDIVWMPAHLQFENGGESVALIPTRYPGSEAADDPMIILARKTVWEPMSEDMHSGLGQRVIATDAAEVPLMEIRTISFTGAAEETKDPAADHG